MLIDTKIELNPNAKMSLYEKLAALNYFLESRTNPGHRTQQLTQIPLSGVDDIYDMYKTTTKTPKTSLHTEIQTFYRENKDEATKLIIKKEREVNPLLQNTINGKEGFLPTWHELTDRKRRYKIGFEFANEKFTRNAELLMRLSYYASVAKPGLDNSDPIIQASTGLATSALAIGFFAATAYPSWTFPLTLGGLTTTGVYGGIKDQETAIKAGDEELEALDTIIKNLY